MKKTLVLLGCALYTLSPLDFIPDVIPVLGWLDDIGVIAFAINYLARARELAHAERAPRGARSELAAAPEDPTGGAR